MINSYNFPKGPISEIKGRCILLKGDDIDTDRIIPARFLKCVNFDNLGKQVFADDRKEKQGLHPFDKEINQGASILIVNRNFGCGSSREHAPQALMRWGIRALIGISFAEIFYGNCLTLGIPCVKVLEKDLFSIESELEKNKKHYFDISINSMTIKSPNNEWSFYVEKSSSEIFLSGKWDATSTLMEDKEKITNTMHKIPYLNQFKNL